MPLPPKYRAFHTLALSAFAACLPYHAHGQGGILSMFGGDDGRNDGGESGQPPDELDLPPGMVMQGLPPGMLMQGLPPGFPGGIVLGAPVMVMQGHFGHDPFEDLHLGMSQAMEKSKQAALPGGGGDALVPVGQARGLGAELENLLSAFGDQHAGHVGRAGGGFQVDDHPEHFRVTALLPGYNLGDAKEGHDASESPLSVRAIGHRSLVVRGQQQTERQIGTIIKTWQRSFALPKGLDVEHISVTYNSKSGNLTVDVPRKTGADANAEDEDEGAKDEDEDLPPALKALSSVPGLLDAMFGDAAAKPTALRGGAPQGIPLGNLIDDLVGQMGHMHPRFQLPPGGDRPPPEDADIHFLGCFEESQLEKDEQPKYYGEANAASFNAMFWHAKADDVPVFAMARHQELKGHAFTAHGLVKGSETPKWGVYDGCGSRCGDSDSRWCGCANEAERGFPNPDCAEEDTDRRFAVYRIGNLHSASEPPAADDDSAATIQPSLAAAQPQLSPGSNQGRAHWKLQEQGAGIDIFVPKGLTAMPKGREVLFYNSTEAEKSDAAAAGSAEDGEARPGAPAGRMKLPTAVNEQSCHWAEELSDGSRVLKCALEKDRVRDLPIQVIDEL